MKFLALPLLLFQLFASAPLNASELQPYLLPDESPIKKRLDALFAKPESLANHEKLELAGFTYSQREKSNQVLVLSHPKLTGYKLKVHLDSQTTASSESMCLKRARGAALIRAEIEKKGNSAFFAVPNKWIYRLPNREGRDHCQRYLLVAEEMRLLPELLNARCWKSKKKVSEKMLKELYELIEQLGLVDSIYIDNIPFCIDGRIAFIDTENHLAWPVPYGKLTGRLSTERQHFWKRLTR